MSGRGGSPHSHSVWIVGWMEGAETAAIVIMKCMWKGGGQRNLAIIFSVAFVLTRFDVKGLDG